MLLSRIVLGAAVAGALSFAGAVASASAAQIVVPIAAADTPQEYFYLTSGTPFTPSITANFGATVEGALTDFDYLFTFTIPQDGEGSGSLSTSFTSALNQLTISDVVINGTSFLSDLQFTGAGQTLSVNGIPVVNGMLNTIQVLGTTASNATAATFNGTATFTAGAIPEPATWAMMIGGFGVVGTMLRRRRSASQQFA